jgi:molybdenum cofactor guanylyltransferase
MTGTGPSIAAVILAGGRGERLGSVVKANLVVGGQRLLDRVAAALAGTDIILVAVGGFGPNDITLAPGQIAVLDPATDYAGPLAGLAAAVAWVATQPRPPELLLTAAVDTPFLPHNFARAMATAIEPGHAGVVARYGAQDYPTNAIWRLERIAALPARMAVGTAPHSLRGLAAELKAPTLSWPDSDGGNPFANANTPAELRELESRAEMVTISSAIGHSGLGN